LAIACPSCGAWNGLDSTFCGSCGSKLQSTAPAASPLREERRITTVLFADFSGFTSLSEQLDPEEVKAIGSAVTGQMGEHVLRFGGTVVNVMGDGIMAVFGAPVAHEDDAERAVRCALEMVGSVRPPGDSEGRGSIHIGINTGEVMAGIVGPAEHREYTVMGDVTNTAARLESAASAGQIVVGEATRDATIDSIEYEPLEPVLAKGKREPVPAWLAVRARGSPAQRRVSSAPLIGRRAQLDLLRGIWEETRAGSRADLLTIFGVAGIGKTRLVREFVDGLDPTVSVLRGRNVPYGEATGYDAFVQTVRAAAGIDETESVEVERDKLVRLVHRLIPDGAAQGVVDHLSLLMGVSSEGAPDRQPLFSSARRLVEACGRDAPTVLVLEDLHWAPPSMLSLVEFLAARVRDAPVLVLTTARPELFEIRPSWGGGLPRYVAVDLQPLGDDEARRLGASLLPSSGGVEAALDRLVAAGGGNPLFLEEFATSVAERTARQEESVPATVQAVIAASVAGQVFSLGTLKVLAGTSADESLESLERRDLIRREPGTEFSADPQFIFKHILTRDVAYQILPKGARPALHAAAATHLASAGSDRVRDEAALIAWHWQLAGEPSRAVPYLLRAADGASRTWAKERAIELYGDALDIVGEGGDAATIEHALLGRSKALLASNEFGSTTQSDIERLMSSSDDATRALATELRARLAYWSGDAAGALRYGEAALAEAKGTADAAVESRALGLLGEVRAMSGELDEAERLSLAGVSHWPEDAKDGNYAYTCSLLALFHYWRGQYEDALRWAEIGYQLGVETSHLAATIHGAEQASLALADAGRYEESLEWIERAVTAGREWEPKPQLTSRAINIWAGTLREIGDLAESRRLSYEAEELARSASFPGARISAGIDLLILDMLQGRLHEASVRLPALKEEAEGTKGWHQWLFVGRLAEAEARLECLSGRPDEAIATADRALELAGGKGRRKYVSRCLATRGDAMLAMGRVEEASSNLREAAVEAERLGHLPLIWTASRGLADALERSGDDEGAAAARTAAADAVATVAGSLSEEHRSAFLRSTEGSWRA
jgi:class 3 adenylate cyclase/tetratricopeptide (TPR) repeat protein